MYSWYAHQSSFADTHVLLISSISTLISLFSSTVTLLCVCKRHQPTVGPPISRDLEEEDWGKKIEMKDLSGANNRDVRQEIEESLDQFVEEPLGGYRIDPSDKSQEEELKRLLKSMQDSSYDGPYAIEDDDDLSTIYGKLTASDEDFQLF